MTDLTSQEKPQLIVRKLLWIALVLLLCYGKYYHYNYIENERGQARTLRIEGLRDFVCQGLEYKKGGVDHCGRRSIYGDADWGVTAYFMIYGIGSKEEAQAIAEFMKQKRKEGGQEGIPVNVEMYSMSRSEEGDGFFRQSKIFEQSF